MDRDSERVQNLIQRNRPDTIITEDLRIAVADIMRNSGSEATIRNINFMRASYFYYEGRMLFGLIPGIGFYFAGKGKKHVRLIELAIAETQQGKGYGTMLLNDLIRRTKAVGVKKITMRTPRKETAVYFWQKKGAVLKGITGDDYEMELDVI